MAIGDIFLVDLQSQIEQRVISNVFGYVLTAGDSDPLNAQILADRYWIDNAAVWLALVATDVVFSCVVVHRVTAPALSPGLNILPVSTVGTRPGTAVPANSAAVAKFVQSAVSARHNGRKYVSGISELDLTLGLVDTAILGVQFTAWAAQHAAQISAPAPGNQVFDPTVVERPPKLPAPQTYISHPVTNIVPQPILFQQRRRRTRRTGSTS